MRSQVHLKIRIYNNINQEALVIFKLSDRRINCNKRMKYSHLKNSGNLKNKYIVNKVIRKMLNLNKE
jgi:hypothetical protein